MRTDFDFPNKDLLGPVVFRPEFTNFQQISANQAWSLFFTAGQDDKALGQENELGKFFSNLLIASGVTASLWAAVFTHLA